MGNGSLSMAACIALRFDRQGQPTRNAISPGMIRTEGLIEFLSDFINGRNFQVNSAPASLRPPPALAR